jgi:hypothetical protein
MEFVAGVPVFVTAKTVAPAGTPPPEVIAMPGKILRMSVFVNPVTVSVPFVLVRPAGLNLAVAAVTVVLAGMPGPVTGVPTGMVDASTDTFVTV